MNLSGAQVLKSSASKIFLRALRIGYNPFTQCGLFRRACEEMNPRFDLERELVRFELEKDDRMWPEEIVDATMNLASFLNMCRGETPLTGKYDLIIASGGARRAPLHRATYAAQSILDDRAITKDLVLAGSSRVLREDEKPYQWDYAPGSNIEFELYQGAAKKILVRHPELNLSTVHCKKKDADNIDIIDEVMRWHNAKYPNSGSLSVAMVTTRIYTVGLYMDMSIAAERYGWRNFVAAGHASEPDTVFNRTVTTYFAECLSTLDKAARAAQIVNGGNASNHAA